MSAYNHKAQPLIQTKENLQMALYMYIRTGLCGHQYHVEDDIVSQ